MNENINTLWKEHYDAKFPKLNKQFEIKGIDLNLLDSLTAGCISTYVTKNDLDKWRLSVLGVCYGELEIVTSDMKDQYSLDYFNRLKDISKLILKAIANENEKKFK